MDKYTATEQAFKNGYERGYNDGKPKWIPVSERLPNKGVGQVLVVKQYRGKQYIDIGEILEGKAFCYSDDYCVQPREHILTHWMPLPEPPKEDEL